MDNQRNLIVAVVLSLVILFGFDFVMSQLYPQQTSIVEGERVDSPSENVAARVGEDGVIGAGVAGQARDLASALAVPERVSIDAPEVAGSINPVGARVDDIVLKGHRQTVERDSGPIRLDRKSVV